MQSNSMQSNSMQSNNMQSNNKLKTLYNLNNECRELHTNYFKCLTTTDVDNCKINYHKLIDICDKHNTLNYIARQRYI